jgi:hypothetical protein
VQFLGPLRFAIFSHRTFAARLIVEIKEPRSSRLIRGANRWKCRLTSFLMDSATDWYGVQDATEWSWNLGSCAVGHDIHVNPVHQRGMQS